MKRIFATVIGLSALLGLGACGGSSETKNTLVSPDGIARDYPTIAYECNSIWGPYGVITNPTDDELHATVTWTPRLTTGLLPTQEVRVIVPPWTEVPIDTDMVGEYADIIDCGNVVFDYTVG